MDFRYDLAISFAGVNRDLALYLASELRLKFNVFFDEFEKANLWGADLTIALPERYVESRYCLIILSKEYLERAWTTLERQAIIMEFLARRGTNYVLPLIVGPEDVVVPGISGLTGYMRVLSQKDWPDIVAALVEKLSSEAHSNGA